MSKFFKMQADWAGVSVERATPNVPDDDRFHIIVNGVIVKSVCTMRAAIRAYRAAINATGKKPPLESAGGRPRQDVIRQEADDIEFYRAAIYWSYSSKYAKGGKLQNRH